jgi:hypothetical protein
MTQEKLAEISETARLENLEGLRKFIAQRLYDMSPQKMPAQAFDQVRDSVARRIDAAIDDEIPIQLKNLLASN